MNNVLCNVTYISGRSRISQAGEGGTNLWVSDENPLFGKIFGKNSMSERNWSKHAHEQNLRSNHGSTQSMTYLTDSKQECIPVGWHHHRLDKEIDTQTCLENLCNVVLWLSWQEFLSKESPPMLWQGFLSEEPRDFTLTKGKLQQRKQMFVQFQGAAVN